jgi:hypothetical protein
MTGRLTTIAPVPGYYPGARIITRADTAYYPGTELGLVPIYGMLYSPPPRGYDEFFLSSYYAPGPSNFSAGLNGYYPSPRYWNYYYPGY